VHRPFVRHELRVPDLDEAVRFYGTVFGWAFEDNPMGKSITHRGVVIGGAGAVKAGPTSRTPTSTRRRGPSPRAASSSRDSPPTPRDRAHRVDPRPREIDLRGVRATRGWRCACLRARPVRVGAQLGGTAEDPVLLQGTAGYALVRDGQGVPFAVRGE
jgi:catechol 2,3-dioxygenase-like lactoylglutathione lyase family enzyme